MINVLPWPLRQISVESLGFTGPANPIQARNMQDLKDLLLMSWCQIPQEIFGGLVESVLRHTSELFGSMRGTYWAGGFNFVAKQYL